VAPQIEVTIPTSPQGAAHTLRECPAITIVAGATIVMPGLRSGGLRPQRVMLLTQAGMDGVRTDERRIRIGATTRLADLAGMPQPLAGSLAGIADREIRAQATIAGNLCAPAGPDAPRGDLQGPLIALGATVRWTDGETERTDTVEDFLIDSAGPRLVLEVELELPRRGGHAALRRPHSHGYTALAVSAAETEHGLRLAATGLGPHGVRLRCAEDPTPVHGTGAPPTDAIASDWYRRELLPVLVRRALAQIEMQS
jgi:CO/xanthine dehydrogenase FAD-binding subunit